MGGGGPILGGASYHSSPLLGIGKDSPVGTPYSKNGEVFLMTRKSDGHHSITMYACTKFGSELARPSPELAHWAFCPA